MTLFQRILLVLSAVCAVMGSANADMGGSPLSQGPTILAPVQKSPAAAPSSPCTGAISGWSGCDWSNAPIAIISQVTGATSYGQPTSGYNYVPNLSPLAIGFNNASGFSNGISGAGNGRTGATAVYVKATNLSGGQGDTFANAAQTFCTGYKASATSTFANPACILFGGSATAGQDGIYEQGVGDIALSDSGHSVSMANFVARIKRTRAARSFSLTTTGDTAGTTTINNITSVTGVVAGDSLSGTDIVLNTTVISVDSGCTPSPHCVIVSTAPQATTPGETLTFFSCCSDNFVIAYRAQTDAGTTVSGDSAFSTAGLWVAGADYTPGTYSSNDAIALAANQRIDGNATSNGLQAPTASTTYFTFDGTKWNWVVSNGSVFQVNATQATCAKICAMNAAETHHVNSPAQSATIAVNASNDFDEQIDTSVSATTVNLPGSPATGKTYYVCDTNGTAATNNILVTPAAGNIDDASPFTLWQNYGCWFGRYNGTIWKTEGVYNPNAMSVLAQSGAATSAGADTSEDTLATITVPAGILRLNGCLVVSTAWSFTGSTNSKTFRVRYSGASGTQYLNASTTTAANVVFNPPDIRICNTNSASAQTGINNSGTPGLANAANTSSSVNTANVSSLVITGQKANSGETLTLLNYSVVFKPAA